jgi:hypothetical protein
MVTLGAVDKLPRVANVSFRDTCTFLKGCAAALPNLAISLYKPLLVSGGSLHPHKHRETKAAHSKRDVQSGS